MSERMSFARLVSAGVQERSFGKRSERTRSNACFADCRLPIYYALCGLMLFRLTNYRLARPVRLARAEGPDLVPPGQGLRLVDSRERASHNQQASSRGPGEPSDCGYRFR